MSNTVYTLTLPVDTPEYVRRFFERAFFALSRVHNAAVSHAIGRLNVLKHDSEYIRLKSEYGKLAAKDNLSPAEAKLKKKIGRAMNQRIRSVGLTKGDLEKYTKIIGKKYAKILSSQQVQKETDRVWTAVEKVLYSNGKKLHYKPLNDFDTISGKTNTNGIKFNPKTLMFTWMGNNFYCKIPRTMSIEYLLESLERKISYCDLKRRMFPNGLKYYLVVTLEGTSPLVHEHADSGTSGVDIGTSTVACASSDKLFLEILARGVERYEFEISRLNRKMDSSRRLTNPERYNPDGTYKKGSKSKWTFSKNYLKLKRRFKSLNRQRSAFIECAHRKLANEMIRHSVHFIVEKMNFQSLAKRAKETKLEAKPKLIVDKNGIARVTRKYAKKKRYGHSILSRAPSLFLTILERKACRYGGELSRVNTTKFRASQYNHVTDTYTPAGRSVREKQIGDTTVQRDLYSAFLLSNSDGSLEHADRERCSAGFAKFVELHGKLIAEMKASGISRKSCFGF
ncbi:MAG: hypothetical protein IJI41_13865 [Anaerolineaceae bacterium]|nr:hypothetical protein [Anaerolineaceae bacterium]